MSGGSAEARRFYEGLEKALSRERIHKYLVERHGKEIVNAVIGAAKAGIGPDGPYPAYEPSYTKQLQMRTRIAGKKGGVGWSRVLAKAELARQSVRMQGKLVQRGGHFETKVPKQYKNWMHRAQAAGNKLWLTLTGTMLNPKNFGFEIDGQGRCWLTWKSPGGACDTYAVVHQEGLALGKGKGKKREWFNVVTPLAYNAIIAAYEKTLEALRAEWNSTP